MNRPDSEPVDIGHVTPFRLLQAVQADNPFVITQGGRPVGYFAPYNGETDVPIPAVPK